MSFVSRGMRAASWLLLLVAAPAAAEETRLGNFIRWYLAEEGPARREDLLQQIERICEGDPARVAASIRAGEHFRHETAPALATGGPVPRFSLQRPRILPVAGCAGDLAQLVLPERYDPSRAYPLVVELGHTNLDVPAGSVLLRVRTAQHEQARSHAWTAEALVLSLIAHLFEVVHVDPERVFLRAEGALAPLAWFVALENPDRFAGVLGARGVWEDGARLAANGACFSGLIIERRRGDPLAEPFFESLQRFSLEHVLLHAPQDASQDRALVPAIEQWWQKSVRRRRRASIELVADRGVAMRAFWLTMVPLVPSQKNDAVGRHWSHKTLSRPARLRADLKEGNLIEVQAERVNKFVLHIDPELFDPDLPLRVSVNGSVPVARPLFLEIADLLEDYRQRRDPGLLYCCNLDYPVR